MDESASMKAAVKAINKVRSRYKGKAVIYRNNGVEYHAVIEDMSYDPNSFNHAAQEWGCWYANISYLPFIGAKDMYTLCPPVSQLIPDGWTA